MNRPLAALESNCYCIFVCWIAPTGKKRNHIRNNLQPQILQKFGLNSSVCVHSKQMGKFINIQIACRIITLVKLVTSASLAWANLMQDYIALSGPALKQAYLLGPRTCCSQDLFVQNFCNFWDRSHKKLCIFRVLIRAPKQERRNVIPFSSGRAVSALSFYLISKFSAL